MRGRYDYILLYACMKLSKINFKKGKKSTKRLSKNYRMSLRLNSTYTSLYPLLVCGDILEKLGDNN